MESEAGAIRTSRVMPEYPAGMPQPGLEGSTLRTTLRTAPPKHALHSGLHGIVEGGIICYMYRPPLIRRAGRRRSAETALPNGCELRRRARSPKVVCIVCRCAATRQTTRNQPETASQPKQAVVNRDPAMCRSEGCIGMPAIRQSIIMRRGLSPR